eukprot:TRINITY_DN1466_c0_g1_i3.p1 TRINITY_DN1466_c0_g1~~TRINITY_DN1466_c0_g1_i3.p1  ORF type:complete len:385 (+),score=127.34 TRINITY_DN1466_c0_g1_i3:73-1227(+)
MRFEPKKWLQAAKTLVLYTTVKQVVIKSIKLRLFKYFIQALVAAYVVFVIIYEKHYTHELDGFGFTQVVLKGNAYQLNANNSFRSIWDQTDIVIPGKERDAIFVVSNVQQTLHQQRGICDGVDNSTERPPCIAWKPTLNGIELGPDYVNTTSGYCKIRAWCPPETHLTPTTATALPSVGNLTMTVRNYARWRSNGFNYSRDTITAVPNATLNFFSIEYLINQAGFKYSDVMVLGVVLGVIFQWNCNLELPNGVCMPVVEVVRLDNSNSALSTGFNFRYTNTYRLQDGDDLMRDLYKVYGVRILFLTSAVGMQFDWAALVIQIGSGMGMLMFAALISDLICMWFIPHAPLYRNKKFMNVDEQRKESKRQEWKQVLTPEQLNKAFF